jgi:serine/threonine protein kinase
VHRDVKPANVLLATDAGRLHAYLTDFGVSRLAADAGGPTRTGTVLGTIDYMAPEQFEGAPLDGRVDVYALGCVLYQALTGQVPFPRDSEPAKMFAHLSQPPPLPAASAPAIPAGLDQVHDGVIHVGTTDDVTPIDERSFVVGEPIPLKGGSLFAPDDDAVWVAFPLQDELHRLDRSGAETRGTPFEGVGKGVGDMLVLDGEIWLTDSAANTVVRVRVNP